MNEFETNLNAAGDALRVLAEGPGLQAAEALETAFGEAGANIEAALGEAARAGELNFERMAESILRDLARVAAESLATMTGLSPVGRQAVNLNMNFAPGTDERGMLHSQGAVTALLARMVAGGGRFQ